MNKNKEIKDIRIEDFVDCIKRHVSSMELLSSLILFRTDAFDVTNEDFQGIGVILDSIVRDINRKIEEVTKNEIN